MNRKFIISQNSEPLLLQPNDSILLIEPESTNCPTVLVTLTGPTYSIHMREVSSKCKAKNTELLPKTALSMALNNMKIPLNIEYYYNDVSYVNGFTYVDLAALCEEYHRIKVKNE